MARWLTTAANEIEADIIVTRLGEAEIHAWESNSLGGRAGSAGPRDIYVDDADLERAREALKTAKDVSDAEITELATGESTPPIHSEGTDPEAGKH